MSERSIISDKIKRKEFEIQSLEKKLEAARIYLQALTDVMKAIEHTQEEDDGVDSVLRKGSAVARAREVIMDLRRPVHIDELLGLLGREVNRESKASLTSSLAAYVRKEEIFTRPAPNTFGLISLGHTEDAESATQESGPPAGFGAMASSTLDDEIPF